MPRPQGPNYPIMREILARTTFSERSIRHWLATKRKPNNPIMARAWDRALAAAKAKLAKAAS